MSFTSLQCAPRRLVFVAILLQAFIGICAVNAASVTWSGATSTDFEAAGNWGGVAPVNDLTSSIGVFTSTPTTMPALTISRSIAGLDFESTGWTLGGTGNLLTLGSSGITAAAVTGSNVISSDVSLSANQSWSIGSGNTLVISGSLGGTSAVAVTGGGTIKLTSALGFNGAMTVSSGTVVASTTGTIGSSGTGSLTVNGGTFMTSGASIYLGGTSGAVTTNGGNITINSGTLDLGGGTLYNQTTGTNGATSSFIMNGGTVNVSQLLASVAGSDITTFKGGTINVSTRVSMYNGVTVLGGGTSQMVMNLKASGSPSKFAGTTSGTLGVVLASNGTLNLDSSASSVNQNMISDVSSEFSAVFRGGSLSYLGGTTVNATEIMGGNVTVDQGASTLSVVAGSGKSAALTSGTGGASGNLNRTAGATILFRGSTLGQSGTGTANSANLFFSTAPTSQLVGAVNSGTNVTNLAILPYAVGDATATGLGSGFVTYNTALGIRVLNASEYTSAVSTSATDSNVKLAAADTLTASGTVNSLVISSGTLNGATYGLSLASGALLATGGGNQINTASLNFGTREAIITANSDLLVSGTVTGSGGLTKSGTGTLTLSGSNTFGGTVYINQGALSVGSGGLGSSSNGIVFYGTTLNVSGSGTSGAVALNTTGGNINVTSGTYTLAGTVSGSGALNYGGGGALILGGANTYSGGSVISSGTVYANNASALGTGAVSVASTTGTTVLQLMQNLSLSNGLTLSGTTSAPGILETSTNTLTTGTVTVNSGGILQISGTVAANSVAGSVVVNSGGTIQSLNNGTGASTNTINGNLTLNSGAVLSTNLNQTTGLYGRLGISGNFVANAGSTLADNATGYIALNGTSAVIGSGVTLVSATTGQGPNVFTLALSRGSGTTTLTSASVLDTVFVRDTELNSTGTPYTGVISSSVAGQNIGQIVVTNRDGSVTPSLTTVRLGSNLTVVAGKGILSQNGNASSSPIAFDLAGYAYDASLASGSGAWAPNTSGTSSASPWSILSSSGTGTFKAGYFTLTGTSTDVTVGSNVVLEAVGTNQTTDLGLKTGGVGTISASSTFVFDGSGNQNLQSSGSRTIGNLQVGNALTSSTLTLNSDIATGAGSTVTVNNSSRLALGAHSLTTSGTISLSGGTIASTGTGVFTVGGMITASGSNSVISAPIALSTTGNQDVVVSNSSTNLSVSGGISGNTTSLTKSGAGTLTLTGANTYTGATIVSAGELDLSTTGTNAIAGDLTVNGGTAKLLQANQIASSKNLVVGGGTFDIGANNQTVANVQMTGGNINGSSGTLTSAAAYDLQSGAVSAKLGGAVALNKTTTSMVTLTGANTYSGATTISSGTLALTGGGSIASSTVVTVGTSAGSTAKFDVSGVTGGTFNVASGQTLKGGGAVVGNVSVGSGATLAPGNSPGTLAITGNATYAGLGTYQWEINDAVGTTGTNPGWDWNNISGTLTISATSSSTFKIDITSLNGLVSGTAANWNANGTYHWTIATAAGGITGFNQSAFTLDTTNFKNTTSGNGFSLSLSGSTDLVLNYVGNDSALSVPGTTTLKVLAGSNVTQNVTISNGGSTSGNFTATSGSSTTIGSASGTVSGSGSATQAVGFSDNTTLGARTGTAFTITNTSNGSDASNHTTTLGAGSGVYAAALLSGTQSTSGNTTTINLANASGAYRAAAQVSAVNLSNYQAGFSTSFSGSGTTINSGTSAAVAQFDSTSKLNGAYKGTLGYTAQNDASILGAGTGDLNGSIALSVDVSGNKSTSRSDVYSAQILLHQSYAGYGIESGVSGGKGTVATLLGGSASALTTVSMSMDKTALIHDNSFRTSDILTLDGMNAQTSGTGLHSAKMSDLFVLQMTYDPATATGDQYIAYFDSVLGQFVNAISGNSVATNSGTGIFDGGLGHGLFVTGTYSGQTTLGTYGFDAGTHIAWAVLDHSGAEFAVIPEPATWAMFVGGIGMLGFVQRLRRRSNA